MLHICIKVFDEKIWADYFLEYGEMLFSHVSVMQEIKDAARRDPKEGRTVDNVVTKIGGEISRVFIDNTHYIDLDKAAKDGIDLRGKRCFLQIDYVPDCYLYSFAHITEYNEDIKGTFEELKKFGDHAVIIFAYKEFLKRINGSIKDAMLSDIKYTTNAANIFEKTLDYKLESECRIAFKNENYKDKKVKKRIGAIKDIAYYCTTDKFDDLAQVALDAVKLLNKKISF